MEKRTGEQASRLSVKGGVGFGLTEKDDVIEIWQYALSHANLSTNSSCHRKTFTTVK